MREISWFQVYSEEIGRNSGKFRGIQFMSIQVKSKEYFGIQGYSVELMNIQGKSGELRGTKENSIEIREFKDIQKFSGEVW